VCDPSVMRGFFYGRLPLVTCMLQVHVTNGSIMPAPSYDGAGNERFMLQVTQFPGLALGMWATALCTMLFRARGQAGSSYGARQQGQRLHAPFLLLPFPRQSYLLLSSSSTLQKHAKLL
jgi:hypothetical protein